MNYQSRLALYEQIKRDIARTAKSPEEYRRRVAKLAAKLKV